MAKSYAFLIPLQKSVAGNGSDSLQYSVPQNAVLHIKDWQWLSDGIFDLVGFGDNTGLQFTSATQTQPIHSSMLPTLAVANDVYAELPLQIDLLGGYQIIANVVDKSTSTNVIKVVLRGIIEYPSSN